MSLRLPAAIEILAKHFRHGIAAESFHAGRNFERDGEQRVARQDGNAVTENFVAGRAAAPEIVVVHARQIVVNERIGVDALHCAGQRRMRHAFFPLQPSADSETKIGRNRLPPANKL